ncbi:Gfo/Idh/MocA family protein [Gluconacetobacter sacchari]|uniref:Gfo/Idh/MocA family oxidoreductase n=2 Tax=Gluconacetobacter sacchari TaxID=92759 RepID=A0A7W4ICA3_9PROT|nr:Gfo/Idh/MocA family oxidoreductase [Gluconacetobacter sacchari]MBB2160172.1 Gfo/Idh/MocA family oxidoreductase [Gluconacetobacter sacchari]GBQ30270.1 oxidoreductase domain protein [Gluconacetobacter sacchari DSM 12717]
MTNIAFVGTGYVADYYMTTLRNYPELRLKGVWDRDPQRLRQFCTFYSLEAYAGLEELLHDDSVDIVVNLTTPESHFAVNKAALDAGKHVYCEKPMAMSVEEAETLAHLAGEKNLLLCGAPANGLSDAFLLTRGLMEKGEIGRPNLVYAEMDDGPVFRGNWHQWRSRSGAPWPGLHEFEVGCTLEHAGYALSWLYGLFGPIVHVAASSALTFRDKGVGDHKLGPDFSVGCLTFRSGVVARLTSGLAAPRDRSLTILGEKGSLTVRDLWDNRSAVSLLRDYRRSLLDILADGLENRLGRKLPVRFYRGQTVRYPRGKAAAQVPPYPSKIDFARGIQAQADGIRSGQPPLFSGRVSLHLTEIILALSSGQHDHTVKNLP